MYRIAKLPDAERRIIFRNTAQKMGLNETIKMLLPLKAVRVYQSVMG